MRAPRGERAAGGSNEAIAFTAFLLLVTVVMLAATFGLRASSASVPRMVGVPVAALLCYRLVRELGDRLRRREGDEAEPAALWPEEARTILWILALPAVSTVLGFVAGPALFVSAWTRYRASERLATSVAAGGLTALLILGLFAGLLGAPLPQGLLGFLANR